MLILLSNANTQQISFTPLINFICLSQEFTSCCRLLSRLLLRSETTLDANNIRCYCRRRRSYYTKHSVNNKHRKCSFIWLKITIHFILSIRFVQSWRVKNNGDEVWPYGCYLKSTSSDNLPTTPIECVEPGHCTVVSVKLVSPPEIGSFQTKWRLFTSNGSCFGGTYVWPIYGNKNKIWLC